jgi:hypothetical protein
MTPTTIIMKTPINRPALAGHQLASGHRGSAAGLRALAVAAVAAASMALGAAPAQAQAQTQAQTQTQTTEVRTEYLMSFEVALDLPLRIDPAHAIAPGKPGGWVRGPKIEGRFIAPGGDWARVMPSGQIRLDVRAVVRTNDEALVYLAYNGVLQHSRESLQRAMRGEVLKAGDVPYYVVAPTFQTSAEKYAWLNGVQAVAKMSEMKLGEGGYVRYDVFIVR